MLGLTILTTRHLGFSRSGSRSQYLSDGFLLQYHPLFTTSVILSFSQRYRQQTGRPGFDLVALKSFDFVSARFNWTQKSVTKIFLETIGWTLQFQAQGQVHQSINTGIRRNHNFQTNFSPNTKDQIQPLFQPSPDSVDLALKR